MNIQTVAENLRNTIAGKERMLTEYTEAANHWEGTGHIVFSTMRDVLVINIDELKRILQDVEQCVKKASDDSWMLNPDRSGGGGYSAEELDPNRGWK